MNTADTAILICIVAAWSLVVGYQLGLWRGDVMASRAANRQSATVLTLQGRPAAIDAERRAAESVLAIGLEAEAKERAER